MRIVLLGKDGLLGHALQPALAQLAHAHQGELVTLGRRDGALKVDFTEVQSLRRTLLELRPDVIVNAAAYTAVDKAESEPELAMQINADAVAVLAETANLLGAWLVHYSTDYVFDGTGHAPWQESDTPAPLSAYGRSKLAGDLAASRAIKHLIFRSGWGYGAHGRHFARTLVELAMTRPALRVVNDQIGAPTSAELVARCTALALERVTCEGGEPLAGLYHLSARGETSWYDYAALIVAKARAAKVPLALQSLQPVASRDYPTPARRPLNSRLACEKFERAFAITLPHWQAPAEKMLESLLAELNQRT